MKPWPHPDPPVAAGDVDAVLTAGPTRSDGALRGWGDEVDPAAPPAAEGAARPRRPTGLPAP
jgi:hypothetical protein